MVVNGGRSFNLSNPNANNFDVIIFPRMAGTAVLICHNDSHPFLNRALTLDEPVKIGRSVARARAAQNNGIFDCKVLSRNHALLWYADGKFFVQDTKSSNGTFVNNQRLSKSGEESAPREVCSGDVVQFGVDVLENSRKVTQPVTHGCIVAQLKLYLPDGKEAKASPPASLLNGPGSVAVEDLYQLNQHIQEALQREQTLQIKLASLQQLVVSLQHATNLSWKAFIAEDRLLSRVETLETQLQTYSKNFAEDKLHEELRKLNEDKTTYQTTAKECLKKILEEKLEILQKYEDLKLTLMNTEADCANFKVLYEQSSQNLLDMELKLTAQIVKSNELQEKLQVMEEQLKEEILRLETDNDDLNNEIQKHLSKQASLIQKIDRLESEDRFGKKFFTEFSKDFLPDCKIYDHLPEYSNPNNDTLLEKNDLNLEVLNEEKEDVMDASDQMDVLLGQLTNLVEEQQKTKDVIGEINRELVTFREEKLNSMRRINTLQHKIEMQSLHLNMFRDENKVLDQRIISLENLSETALDTQLENVSPEVIEKKSGEVKSKKSQLKELRDLVTEVKEKARSSEGKINILNEELEKEKNNVSEATNNYSSTLDKLEDAQKIIYNNEVTMEMLRHQIKSLESVIMETRIQEKLERQYNINNKREETLSLKKELSEVQQILNQTKNDYEQLQEKFRSLTEEHQALLNQGRNEPILDNRTMEDYIDVVEERKVLRETVQNLKDKILILENEKLIKKESEYIGSQKIKTDGSENNVTVNCLQTSDIAINSVPVDSSQNKVPLILDNEVVKDSVGGNETETTYENGELTDVHLLNNAIDAIDTSEKNIKVLELEDELVLVKQRYMTCNAEKSRLEKENLVLKDYLSDSRSSTHNVMFWLPLIFLFIGLTIAFYPTLSIIFGTSERTYNE
uniref:Sarcolemmal membrane-associated protein n=1 Tax=Clastoptera arizonana TaxID=38151 RepID=A0A1B6DJM0_9HEMI